MTTANISDFVSLGLPIGASILALDAPVDFTQGGMEYLRTGSIKAYDASYAPSMLAAPQLRVFGSDAKTYGALTGTGITRYYYVGSNYVALSTQNSGSFYGATLTALAAGTVITGSPTFTACRAAVGGSYVVAPWAVNNAPYSVNGSTVTSVGGTFTSFPVPTAICFGNNSWLSLSTLTATAGEQGYIANAVPTGAWTVVSSTNVGMTKVNAVNYGAALFVAVGASASTIAGLIATCATVGSAWTDRTAASGITFAASETILDAIFDGTAHIAATNTGRVITSTDGINWVNRGYGIDPAAAFPLSGAATWTKAIDLTNMSMATDGAGTTVLQQGASIGARNVLAVSTDHGVTWNAFQAYVGKAPNVATYARTISYANGHWIENHSGASASLVDLGTLITPDYVGSQNQNAAGQYVRIK